MRQNPNICGVFGIHEDYSYDKQEMKCCPVRTAISLMKDNGCKIEKNDIHLLTKEYCFYCCTSCRKKGN